MKVIKLLAISSVMYLSGCAGLIEKQEPICTAQANIGGTETAVQIYGVRKTAGQTQYKVGYPFNWKWVSKSNFTASTCQ
ncbi:MULTISPECIES: hypothetical protein [Enterobacteriaceae]|uniref:phage exclusion lipoprotein Cor n=1 Tax=Enterobacteriaceae TaxID=543 RepID=UPI000272B057|nr:hypothetical protein [Enterobacter sp. Ag1]EJF31680.1 hypothetical protein A936_08808 [Enterobacter sp. Ag1]